MSQRPQSDPAAVTAVVVLRRPPETKGETIVELLLYHLQQFQILANRTTIYDTREILKNCIRNKQTVVRRSEMFLRVHGQQRLN